MLKFSGVRDEEDTSVCHMLLAFLTTSMEVIEASYGHKKPR